MPDIAEQICLAVDQIVTERLKGINYDATIVATIVDDKNANDYKYICSNGSAQFVAFSKDTNYKKGDSVQVTVPNNDYDQQKIIIGKYVIEDESPYVFTQPFETLIDVSGNLILGNKETITGGLLANRDCLIKKENGQSILNAHLDEIHLWTKDFDTAYKEYSRLGLKGSFKSWINALKPISGDYGYRLEIFSLHERLLETDGKTSKPVLLSNWIRLYKEACEEQPLNGIETILKGTPDNWFEIDSITVDEGSTKKKYFSDILTSKDITSDVKKDTIYLILYKNCIITELRLSSKEMYGNPYNFQSFYEQEKVYDVSSLGYIYGMSLYFYEESGTFYNENNELLPYEIGGVERDLNLFTQDPYICLGYDLSAFNKEQAILYSLDSDTFNIKDDIDDSYNTKTIRLRWVHEFDDGSIRVVSEATDLKDYEIRWYRFFMGDPSADEYSGVYWRRILTPTADSEDPITGPTADSSFNFILQPMENVVNEQIKAIVLYNGEIIRSNIITFRNLDANSVVSSGTSTKLAGLSLWCDDGSYGNYFVYGQNNNILEASKVVDTVTDPATGIVNEEKREVVLSDKTIQTLEARFADASILAKEVKVDMVAPRLMEATKIIWDFPLDNTMLVVNGFNYDYEKTNAEGKHLYQNDDGTFNYALEGYFTDKDTSVEVITDRQGKKIRITRLGDKNGQNINALIDYRIAKTYSTTKFNNTVICTVTKDRVVYSAQKEFSFGLMGTNGTDATLVIDFDNNKTALTAGVEESISLTAHLYDQAHNEIDLNDTTNGKIGITWSWYKYGHIATEDNYNKLSDEDKKLTPYLTYANSNGPVKILDHDKPSCSLSSKLESFASTKGHIFLILQVTISNFGDYDLTTYKAIPIRRSKQYRYVVAPTEIIYKTSGYADYYKGAISLWQAEAVNQFDIVSGPLEKTPFVTLSIYNPFNETLIGDISNGIFKPASFYAKDSEPYGIIFYDSEHPNDTPYWIQPLVILQNEYPSATLNKWNGKDVQINKKEGYIVSPAIAAGKKHSDDNTFSGVMLGDWSGPDLAAGGTSDEITKQTGVYGFYHGTMSYAFKEDGSAFIGKSGSGRIHFDGNSSVIKSAVWDSQNNQGMFIDLDDGILKMQKNSRYEPVVVTDYKKDTYYIFRSGYSQIPYITVDEELGSYSPQVSYYVHSLKELGFITKELFDSKKKISLDSSSDALEQNSFYIKNISYELTEKYDPSIINYYVDGFWSVPITLAEYNDSCSDENFSKSKTYYILNSNSQYVLSTEPWNTSTIYYTYQYKNIELLEKDYTKNTYYIVKDGQNFVIDNKESYSGDINYYIIGEKQLVNLNNEEEFNNYKNKHTQQKLYKIKTQNYILIKSSDIFNSSAIYAEYAHILKAFPANIKKGEKPYETWNTSADSNLKDEYKYKQNAGHYFSFAEGYFLDSRESFDPNENYYQYNGSADSRFITLSAEADRYPLAIGISRSEADRNFRVEWDGTAHITDGEFKGTVTADYLYCESGIIGGWQIGKYTLSGGGITLNSREGSIEGGILRSPTGGMELQGYLTVRDGNGRGSGTYFGYMQINTSDPALNATSNGIGMSISEQDGKIRSQVKSTSLNAGLSYSNDMTSPSTGGYLSISDVGFNGAGDPRTTLRTKGYMLFSAKYANTWEGATNGEIILDGTTIRFTADAKNQHGIYARFAPDSTSSDE